MRRETPEATERMRHQPPFLRETTMIRIEAIYQDVVAHTAEYKEWMKEMALEAMKTTAITYAALGAFIFLIGLIS